MDDSYWNWNRLLDELGRENTQPPPSIPFSFSVTQSEHVHPNTAIVVSGEQAVVITGISPKPLVVSCERHGPMFRDEAKSQWICLGISDPRECWVKLTDEKVVRLRLSGEVILR